jgi:hypothetical protein
MQQNELRELGHTMPGSATRQEQLHAAGIDAKAIEAAARALLDVTPRAG